MARARRHNLSTEERSNRAGSRRRTQQAAGSADRPVAAAQQRYASPPPQAANGHEGTGRARRLQVRRRSQQYETAARALRERRVEKHHIATQRLQKVLAFSGLGSRRDMEALIDSGRVVVNGKTAVLGIRVGPNDTVAVDGKNVRLKWQDRLPRIVLYHKQEGELVSRDDPAGRQTVFDRLPRLHGSQWVAIGRLDFNTSGLLIFTTSGALANRMSHPRFEVEREYAVRIVGELDESQRRALTEGVALEDGLAKCERLEPIGGEGLNRWYRLVIDEGRNREVRRMFAHLQLTISRLMRTRFGIVQMPSRLKRGQFYELDEPEVLAVLRWAGLQINGLVKRESSHE